MRPSCRCGHSWEIHQHHRARDDCGVCHDCRTYRRPRTPGWLWLARALLAVWRTRNFIN